MTRKSRSAGFTLLEVAISVAILALVFALAWTAFDETGSEVSATVRETDLDTALRRSLGMIKNELSNSGMGFDGTDRVTSHPSDQDTTSDQVVFQVRVALTGNPNDDWGPPITLELQDEDGEDSSNGVDDDGDGIVDERLLTRNQDGVETIYTAGVTEFTVTRAAGDDFVLVQLALARAGRSVEAPLARQLTTRISLVNKN